MKYCDMNLSEKELRGRTLIKADDFRPCWICREQTNFIDYCSEGRICGEECMEKQNEWLNEHCGVNSPLE